MDCHHRSLTIYGDCPGSYPWTHTIEHRSYLWTKIDHHPGSSTWIIIIDQSHRGLSSCFPSTIIHMAYHPRTLTIHGSIIDHQPALSLLIILRDHRDGESLIIIVTIISNHHHEFPSWINRMDHQHRLYSTSPTKIMKPPMVIVPDRPSYRSENRHEWKTYPAQPGIPTRNQPFFNDHEETSTINYQ